MRVGIPARCQNGHETVCVYRFRGLDAVYEGAQTDCKCPKWEMHQGWRPTGEPPFVIPEDVQN